MDVISVYSSGVKNVIANSGTALTERQIELIWKFFSNPIICLDGDESGKKAAYRIAERLFPFINEKNKIYFSIMPEGKDPDDFIKDNGKEGLINLLKDKEMIQSYIWNYQLSKININSPFEISNFEKEIKKIAYSIKDNVLKKYVVENFLEKISNLTPIQKSKFGSRFNNLSQRKNMKILKETQILHNKRKNLSKVQIIEFSILFIILNFFKIAAEKINELKTIKFISEKNESLKNTILSLLSEGYDETKIQSEINIGYEKLVEEIKENSNVQLIILDKSENEILDLLDELILDLKEQNNLRKIENLEKKLINNLDENSYSELIKLKSQLNRD